MDVALHQEVPWNVHRFLGVFKLTRVGPLALGKQALGSVKVTQGHNGPDGIGRQGVWAALGAVNSSRMWARLASGNAPRPFEGNE